MRMQILRAHVAEQSLDCGFEIVALDDIGLGHHAISIEAAQREQTATQHLGHRVDRIERFLAGTHIDRMARERYGDATARCS